MHKIFLSRSNLSQIFYKIDEYFARFTKQQIDWSVFFSKVAEYRIHFSVNFGNFSEHPVQRNISRNLLLFFRKKRTGYPEDHLSLSLLITLLVTVFFVLFYFVFSTSFCFSGMFVIFVTQIFLSHVFNIQYTLLLIIIDLLSFKS